VQINLAARRLYFLLFFNMQQIEHGCGTGQSGFGSLFYPRSAKAIAGLRQGYTA
jgi:hypothetical protein